MATFLLVDGHAYAYRAFHAIRGMKSPEGMATGAIFGFIKMLGRLQDLLQPTHVAVIWDGGLDEERVELLGGYKADRPPMPEDLEGQIEEIIAYLEAAGITSVRQEEVEADDLIAGLSLMAAESGAKVVIASSDKDFFQLVSTDIGLFNPADKSETVWGADQVVKKTGVRPEQVVDWLSLVGDAVDNIAGVPGVGSKTAAELLRQFGSVDALYERLAEVKSERLRGALIEARLNVFRNRRLIRLKGGLASDIRIEQFVPSQKAYDRMEEMAQRWGFKGLTAEIRAAREREGDWFSLTN